MQTLRLAFISVALFLAILLPSAAADRDGHDTLMLALTECREIGVAADRLACFDDALSAFENGSQASTTHAPSVSSAGGADIPPGVTVAPETAAVVAETSESVAMDEPVDAFGGELLEASRGPDELRSRVMGEFTGWRGSTIFKLENGQTWQQVQAGRRRYNGPPNPEVVIRRKAFGSYRLRIAGSNRTIRVKRID